MKPSAARAHFRDLAASGLPYQQIVPELLDVALSIVPGELACGFVFDGEFGIRDIFAPRLTGMPNEMAQFDWRGLDPRVEPTPDKLIALGRPVNNLARLWDRLQVERSVVYNELSRPLGLERGMDLIIRDPGGRPRAIIYVMRGARAQFGERDEAAFLDLHDLFGQALSVGAGLGMEETAGGGYDPLDEASGLLIADRAGRIVMADPAALELAIELAEHVDPRQRVAIGAHLPAPLDALHRKAGDPARGAPSGCWQMPRGQYRASARYLAGGGGNGVIAGLDGLLALTIARHSTRAVRLYRRVRSLDLTPSQRRIAFLVGMRMDRDDIRKRLGLSPETLRGYLKDIYRRVECEGMLDLYALVCEQDRPRA